MTAKEAWLWCARQWEKRIENWPSRQAQLKRGVDVGWDHGGICSQIYGLRGAARLSDEVRRGMLDTVWAACGPLRSYLYPLTKRGAERRMAFCKKQAKLAA